MRILDLWVIKKFLDLPEEEKKKLEREGGGIYCELVKFNPGKEAILKLCGIIHGIIIVVHGEEYLILPDLVLKTLEEIRKQLSTLTIPVKVGPYEIPIEEYLRG